MCVHDDRRCTLTPLLVRWAHENRCNTYDVASGTPLFVEAVLEPQHHPLGIRQILPSRDNRVEFSRVMATEQFPLDHEHIQTKSKS